MALFAVYSVRRTLTSNKILPTLCQSIGHPLLGLVWLSYHPYVYACTCLPNLPAMPAHMSFLCSFPISISMHADICTSQYTASPSLYSPEARWHSAGVSREGTSWYRRTRSMLPTPYPDHPSVRAHMWFSVCVACMCACMCACMRASVCACMRVWVRHATIPAATCLACSHECMRVRNPVWIRLDTGIIIIKVVG